MAVIQKFTEIEAWKEGRSLAIAIYRVTSSGIFARDTYLKGQIRKAAISIPSNIAEGFERGGRQEFIHFLSIGKGSTGEVQTQLHIAAEPGYFSEKEFRALDRSAEKTSSLLGGFIRYLKNIDRKGCKFSPDGDK